MTREEWIETRDRARKAYLDQRQREGHLKLMPGWSEYADTAPQIAGPVDAAIEAVLGPCPEPPRPASVTIDGADGNCVDVEVHPDLDERKALLWLRLGNWTTSLDRAGTEKLVNALNVLLAWDDERRADQ